MMKQSPSIHIVSVGRDKNIALTVFRSGIDIDKVILLNNTNEEYADVEKNVRTDFDEIGVRKVETEQIDVFDFQQIYDTVEGIVLRETTIDRGCRIHMNITAGTNVVAGAMSCVAMRHRNVDIYYMKWWKYEESHDYDIPIRIDLVDDESLDMLSKRSKTADVLKLFENRACINHEELKKMVNVSAPTLSHHTGILLEHGLIIRGGGNRKTPTWELTEKGKKVLKRLILEEKYRSKTNRSF